MPDQSHLIPVRDEASLMEALGEHLLVELWQCNDQINEPDVIEQAICEMVEAVGATLLHLYVHPFAPQGVTGVAVLAESHCSLHSWPEHGYLAADLFTCGDASLLSKAVEVLERLFTPGKLQSRQITRGLVTDAGVTAESISKTTS